MPEWLSGADGVTFKLRRLLGYMICLLFVLAGYFTCWEVLLVLFVETLKLWHKYMLDLAAYITFNILLPSVGIDYTTSCLITIDCVVRLFLVTHFVVYWHVYHAVWFGQLPPSTLVPSLLGYPLDSWIALLVSYTVSFAIWRPRQVRPPTHPRSPHFLRPAAQEPEEDQSQLQIAFERGFRAAQAAQATQRPATPQSSSCFKTGPSAAETACDRDCRREMEIHWQEEQRRNLEEARRRRRQQATNASALITAAFLKWREDCRTLLQTPGHITEMPHLLYAPCVDSPCKTISSYLQVCTHGLRKLYEDARLDWWELETESRLWNPDGMKVNQMGEDCKKQFLSMADEIAHVLQEIRPFSRAYHAREITMGA
jgi:hypothetical protein